MASIRLPNLILVIGGLFILFGQPDLKGQNLPMDRFCDIYGENASHRIAKIIRLFKLSLRPAEQLTGSTQCTNGETFTLKTSCVGALRVGIFSLSDPTSISPPAKASQLFHLYTLSNGSKALLLCTQPTAP